MLMATPLQAKAGRYELLDRRKGEAITPYFFNAIKNELRKVRWTGFTKYQIASLYSVGIGTVKLIEAVPNFLAYQDLQITGSTKRSRRARPKAQPGLFARIFKGVRNARKS